MRVRCRPGAFYDPRRGPYLRRAVLLFRGAGWGPIGTRDTTELSGRFWRVGTMVRLIDRTLRQRRERATRWAERGWWPVGPDERRRWNP